MATVFLGPLFFFPDPGAFGAPLVWARAADFRRGGRDFPGGLVKPRETGDLCASLGKWEMEKRNDDALLSPPPFRETDEGMRFASSGVS